MVQLTSTKYVFFYCFSIVLARSIGVCNINLTGEAQKKKNFAMFPGTKFSISTTFCHFKTLFVDQLGPQQTIFHGSSVCGAPFFIQIK